MTWRAISARPYAAAAIYPTGTTAAGKLRALLRPASLPPNNTRGAGDGGGGGIVGIPWAHLSDLVVPTAAALATAAAEGVAPAWTPALPTRLPTGGGGLAAVLLADGRLMAINHAVFGPDGRHVLSVGLVKYCSLCRRMPLKSSQQTRGQMRWMSWRVTCARPWLSASVSRDGGDTWCAYDHWKTSAEVPKHILPPQAFSPEQQQLARLLEESGKFRKHQDVTDSDAAALAAAQVRRR